MSKEFIDPLIKNNLWEPLEELEQFTPDDGMRWYSKKSNPHEKYFSVTTINSAGDTASKKHAIEAWKKDQINDGLSPRRAAIEGEHMHELIEVYLKRGYEDPTDYVPKTITIPPYKKIIPESTSRRGYELYKHYHNNFLKTHHIVPHLIEGRLFCEKDLTVKMDGVTKEYKVKYAGTVDLVATIVDPEGNKRLVVVDHKSKSDMKSVSGARKGYIPQLAAYAAAIQQRYGVDVDGALLNFASTRDSRSNKSGRDLVKFKSYFISKTELLAGWKTFKYNAAKFYNREDLNE